MAEPRDTLKEKVRNWLIEDNRFTINEISDNKNYFIFLINNKDQTKQLIPMAVSFPKHRFNEIECLCLTLGWNLDKNSGMITAVFNDPQKTNQFIVGLREKIDPTKYVLQILPNERNVKTIKILRILPIVSLEREYLIKEIINLWMQYGKYMMMVHLSFGMSELARPEDYR